jgi:hypothetical protein
MQVTGKGVPIFWYPTYLSDGGVKRWKVSDLESAAAQVPASGRMAITALV